MDKLLAILSFLQSNFQAILTAIIAAITAVIGVAMLIPGDQPEKFLQSVVDFLAKFSVKK